MFVVTICCDTDPVVARKVARKYENLRLNSLRDVLSIWRRKQCFNLSNVLNLHNRSLNCCLICHRPYKDHISDVSVEGFLQP